MRVRRVLRLRRRARRPLRSAVRRGPGPQGRGVTADPQRLGLSRRAHRARRGRSALDAFVTKTVTPLPREGNPPPRIAETENGMLNSIGLQNPGIDAFVRGEPAAARLRWTSRLGLGRRFLGRRLRRTSANDSTSVTSVTTIELNLSCPNVEEAPETAAELVAAARGRRSKTLYAKLSPATWDVAESARAVAAAGADGLSLVNTIRGLALDPATRRPKLARGAGRLLRTGAATDRPRLRVRLRRRPSTCRSWAWAASATGRDVHETSSLSARPRSPSERSSSPIRGRRIGCAPSSRPRVAPTRCRPGAGIGLLIRASSDRQTLKALQMRQNGSA